ncbi:MAG: ABC transporter substrate-binding protein, partial [Firmicutes bacterium]|nr:ABC transporter substrate-binding protein [Bacillota bacterium]
MAGCGSKQEGASSGSKTSSRRMVYNKVINIAGINMLSCTGTLFVADRLGLFDQLGLKVKIFYPMSGPACLEAYVAGEADVIDIGAMTAILAVDHGVPIKLLTGNHIGHGGFTVSNELYRAGVTDMAAFARYVKENRGGRPVSFGTQVPGTVSELVAQMMLRQWGIDPDRDLHFQPLPLPELASGIISGALDAISVCESFDTVPEVKGKGVVIAHNSDGGTHG